jgi:protein SCO1/2
MTSRLPGCARRGSTGGGGSPARRKTAVDTAGIVSRDPRGSMWLFLAVLALMGATTVLHAQRPGRHEMRGMVLEVKPSQRVVVVSHEDVPGVMPAMTMPFEVRSLKELEGLMPGTIVSFVLVLGKDAAHIEGITVVHYQSVEQDPLAARRLRLLETITGPSAAPLTIGRTVPDFALTNQARRRVSLSQFRGRIVAVNFIYTSCVLPQFCYRLANQFSVVRNRFKDRMGRDLVLLSVTFDPARDTPERLAQYAQQWAADPASWHFLTGSAADVARVGRIFGVDAFADEGLVNHSVRTALVGRDGRLISSIEGNTYTAAQLGDLIETALRR